MRRVSQQKRYRSPLWKLEGVDGVDFVRCRICGDHRRVISGRHLSKHGTDRETYMEEYDLSPDELIAKDFRRLQSSRREYRPYGKKDWIAAIKNIYKRDGNVFAGYLQDKHPHLYDQGVWIFGGWDNALRAAGFNPERMRIRRIWDQEKILKEIRRMRDQNLPLYASYVKKNHAKVFDGALREYGSWNNTLVAAGITNKEIPRKTRLGVLRELREAVESRSAISQELRSQLAYYFGSLRNAKFELKTNARFLRCWSKRKIITVLTQMHRTKQKLDYASARRDFPALVSAAEAYCGSWGNALYAAGIDPNLYFVHHTWRKPNVNFKR
jgi:hypothetical protein